jgi:AcrR family transcriptional regulator
MTLPITHRGSAAAFDLRRDAILKAAGNVFRNKGFQRATTLDIAKAAGVSKRDLYAAFPSKDALLTAMITSGVTTMTLPISLEPAADRAAFYAALQVFGKSLLGQLLSPETLSLYRMAIAEAPSSPALGKALIDAGAGATTTLVSSYVQKAEAAGLVHFARHDMAIGTFFFVLLGDQRLAALLDPDHPSGSERVDRQAALAVAVLQRMEDPRPTASSPDQTAPDLSKGRPRP